MPIISVICAGTEGQNAGKYKDSKMGNGKYRIKSVIFCSQDTPSSEYNTSIYSDWRFCEDCKLKTPTCGFYNPKLDENQTVECSAVGQRVDGLNSLAINLKRKKYFAQTYLELRTKIMRVILGFEELQY